MQVNCNQHICHEQEVLSLKGCSGRRNLQKSSFFFNQMKISSRQVHCVNDPITTKFYGMCFIEWSFDGHLVAFCGKGGQTFLIHWWSWCSLSRYKFRVFWVFRLWKKVILFISWVGNFTRSVTYHGKISIHGTGPLERPTRDFQAETAMVPGSTAVTLTASCGYYCTCLWITDSVIRPE